MTFTINYGRIIADPSLRPNEVRIRHAGRVGTVNYVVEPETLSKRAKRRKRGRK